MSERKKVLSLNNIGKAYRDYAHEWRRIVSWFGWRSQAIKEVWTLRNISFELGSGETLGIVGQNGAGKSTLLKIITGTLKASSGSLTCHGRIAAILELGMGFHPDLTGRQNVYNAAGLMGYNRSDIDNVIDEVASFSEIGDYFDQPVRLYSSGMQVRIAFAVATAYRPDILIIDEALSVGDAYFQHKCFERINTYRKQGTSLLFVSHDTSAILALCDKAILLEKGSMLKVGAPEEVMDFYNALIAQKEEENIEQTLQDGKVQTTSGTGEAKVEEIGVYNQQGDKIEVIGVGDKIELRMKIKIFKPLQELVVGIMIKDRLGQILFGMTSKDYGVEIYNLDTLEEMIIVYKFHANFGIGAFSISTALAKGVSHLEGNCEWKDLAAFFNVINVSKPQFIGLSWIPLDINMQRGYKYND